MTDDAELEAQIRARDAFLPATLPAWTDDPVQDRRTLLRWLDEARAERDEAYDYLQRSGHVRCDIPACNCNSWHHWYGLPERWSEIKNALEQAEVLDNSTGNMPLKAIEKLVAQRDEARAELAKEAHQFQNFHRLLCERFGYGHDPVDWRRDQLSLIEHIAARLTTPSAAP